MRQNNKIASTGDVEIYTVRGDEGKTESRLPSEATHRSPHTGNNQIFKKTMQTSTRYWLTIGCVVFCVVAAILVFVVMPAMIMNSGMHEKDAVKHKESLSIEDVLRNTYSAKLFNGTWESDSEFSYMSDSNLVMLHDMETMTSTNLIMNDSLIPARHYSFTLSPDHKYLLIAYNTTKRYRHIYTSRYSIVDLEAQSSVKLHNSYGALQGWSDSDVVQYATWSSHGNALAYVYRNNIYYRTSAQNSTEHQVTTDGVPELIYNGASDWIYNDAVFASHRAIWFSWNGQKLAYATFNDTMVIDDSITQYGEPGANGTQYSTIVKIRYPKTGSPNPTVALSVVDIDDVVKGVPKVMLVHTPDNASEPILTDVTWTYDEEVAAVWKNRVQNRVWITICNTTVFSCEEVWKTEETEGWVGVFSAPRFSANGRRMLLVNPVEQRGGVGKFRHLTLVDRDNLELGAVALTAGVFTVLDVVAWDEVHSLVYIQATIEGDPAKVQVFTVSDNVTTAPHPAKCVTCGRRTADGDVECTYNTAYFSNQASFYMYHCWGPDIPEITLYNKDHLLLSMWEDNRAIRDKFENKTIPDTLRLQVAVPGGNTAEVRMWLPPNMDPNVKYPLLVDVYAGPDSYYVTDKFEVDWRYYLTCNMSVVYAVIDGRGSGRKGNRMAFASYRQLGTVEAEDQISVTKHLVEKYDFLDRNRTAIWGWSYGGYSTLRVLINDTDGVFKCGMAVAPVTDWMYFTTMYTERMMGMPTKEDNLLGYEESNVIDKVENLRNKKLFLAHGTFDNIVQYQHSMMLVRALQTKSIPFTQQTYPEEDHVLAGVTHHLYQCLLTFLEDCYK